MILAFANKVVKTRRLSIYMTILKLISDIYCIYINDLDLSIYSLTG